MNDSTLWSNNAWLFLTARSFFPPGSSYFTNAAIQQAFLKHPCVRGPRAVTSPPRAQAAGGEPRGPASTGSITQAGVGGGACVEALGINRVGSRRGAGSSQREHQVQDWGPEIRGRQVTTATGNGWPWGGRWQLLEKRWRWAGIWWSGGGLSCWAAGIFLKPLKNFKQTRVITSAIWPIKEPQTCKARS